MKTSIHEVFHVMGFSSGLYRYFIDENGNTRQNVTTTKKVRGNSYNMFITPNIMKFAREFYGCDNVPGIALENDGGSGSLGSHFERVFFFNEVMTASDFKDA